MRIALGIEYDGTGWNGWQTQPNGHTIQDRLEAALLEFTGQAHPTTCAGRTDAGVHAKGQVVHFDTEMERPDWSWVRGLNAFLPETIAVRNMQRVPDDFHARFSARSRQYSYRIFHSPIRSPLLARTTTWFYRPLDLLAMQQAAQIFLGEHDFSAFRSAECQASTPVRTLMRLDIARHDDVIEFTLQANAFLHHMVRSLVGTLVEVGRGAASVDWARQVLQSRDRTLAGRTFAPEGLCLDRVEYDVPLFQAPLAEL